MTDVPHCQAAKDVLADAVAWPACQAPGLQAARERGTERKRGKNTTDGVEIEGIMAKRVSAKTDQVCDETGKLRGETPDTPETVTSHQAD